MRVGGLFESIKFCIEFGKHGFAREAFAAGELVEPFSDFFLELLFLYVAKFFTLFEQPKRFSNDLASRGIAPAFDFIGNKLFEFWSQ